MEFCVRNARKMFLLISSMSRIAVSYRVEKIAEHCAVDAVLPNLQEQAEVSLGAVGRPSGQLQSGHRRNSLEEAHAQGGNLLQGTDAGCFATVRARVPRCCEWR